MLIPRSKIYQEQLFSIYHVEFPDSFFWFCDFLLELDQADSNWFLHCVRLYSDGPTGRILTQNFTPISLVSASPYAAWGDQYSRDVPEFLTCMRSDHSGLHYGLLYDDPAVGVRGAASFYNSDGDHISVYGNMLDVIQSLLGAALENVEEQFLMDNCFDSVEELDDDEQVELENDISNIKQCQNRFQQFIETNQISLDDGRPEGLPSRTNLSLIPAPHLSLEENQAALTLLEQGRSLWYWGEERVDQREQVERSYSWMKQAYEQLNRPILIEILEVYRDTRVFYLEQQQR
jgi:hypothetical protein